MKISTVTAALLSLALAAGCSSESKDPVPGTGTPATGSTAPAPSDTAPADMTPPDTTTTPAPAAPTVKAPKIDEVMKMQGALHVTWTNAEPSCDSIELERKTATVAYKVYRVRCKKAAAYSAYSNEMSGTP